MCAAPFDHPLGRTQGPRVRGQGRPRDDALHRCVEGCRAPGRASRRALGRGQGLECAETVDRRAPEALGMSGVVVAAAWRGRLHRKSSSQSCRTSGSPWAAESYPRRSRRLLDRFGSHFGRTWPAVGELRPNLAKGGPGCGQVRRPNFARRRPILAPRWRAFNAGPRGFPGCLAVGRPFGRSCRFRVSRRPCRLACVLRRTRGIRLSCVPPSRAAVCVPLRCEGFRPRGSPATVVALW